MIKLFSLSFSSVPAVITVVVLWFISPVSIAGFSADYQELSFEQVAVMVFPNTGDATRMKRAAQTRIESILLDNGITVLDREKSEDLKSVWKKLEDPGYFITAEDFVDNASGYDIDGVIRLYLNAEATSGLSGFHTATAQADIRFVDSDAQVQAYTTVPMGVPGVPPSDGLTRNAALVNAVQRAVDEAAGKTGLEIIDYARPRSISYALQGPVEVSLKVHGVPENEESLAAMADIVNQTWTREEVTTTCRAPSGDLAAVGGYIRETSMGMRRSYYSKIHLVDTTENKEIANFDTTTAKKKGRQGDQKLLDCEFITSWRYLAGVTGLQLFLWDTERGVEMSSVQLDKGIAQGRIGYQRMNGKDYISVDNGDTVISYEVVRKK